MKGDPFVWMDHCIRTEQVLSNEVLDFLLDSFLGSFFEKALLTISKIRTLGGAVAGGANGNHLMPTRNVKGCLFVDMIVA